MKMSLHVDKVTCYRGFDEQNDGEVLLNEFTLRSFERAHATTVTLTVRDESPEATYLLNALEKRHVVEMSLSEPVIPTHGTRELRDFKENYQ